MGRIWRDDYRLGLWLKIEIAACEGWARIGKIPSEAVETIKRKASFSWQRVLEIEETTHHDVLAFLTNVAENVGDEAKYIHLGLTSSDVLDTSLAMQLVEASDILLAKMDKLIEILAAKAVEYKDTLQIGRSHGIHAEPITFGLKFALWYEEMKRQKDRLAAAREDIRVGQISGAVGTFANVDPSVEEYVCRALGLKCAPVSTQIIQRDGTPFMLRFWRESPPRWIKSPPKYATFSGRMFMKWKNLLPRGRKVLRPCLIRKSCDIRKNLRYGPPDPRKCSGCF
jgi:adenylosuccinate lyase